MIQFNNTRRNIFGKLAAGVGLLAGGKSGTFIGSATAQLALKTFVLIPGAFCGSWCWRRVADLLEWRGHKVFTPTLTGLGDRSHLLNKSIDMDTHIADIVNLFRWESLEDVCLVAHSYGGAPGSGALEQIADRVSSIVWLDAFKLENDQAVLDVTGDATRQKVLEATDKGAFSFAPSKSSAVLVNEKDEAFVESKLTPHPIETYKQKIRLSGAIETVAKKTYIRIPKYPAPAFDKARAESKAKSWNTLELPDSGHLAMLDAPERLTDLLLEAAY